jgi:ERCC4-type nuclease
VGDFVLTPDKCVERKTIADLVSSLDSGRLYTQAVAMCKHYTTPILLIEFDPAKAFALQSMADIGTEIRASNLASKLVLLLLHFPKLRYGDSGAGLLPFCSLHLPFALQQTLSRTSAFPTGFCLVGVELHQSERCNSLSSVLRNRHHVGEVPCRLVWSRSLHATADMFSLLKAGFPEPETEVAAEVGLNAMNGEVGNVSNPVARDMLLRMPGVTTGNVHKLMEAGGSLAGIADMDLCAVQQAVGTAGGKSLFAFLHAACPT